MVDKPVHIAVLDPALAAGNELTVMVTGFALWHPVAVIVSVTVYVVFEVGFAVGFDTVELLRFVDGLQL